MEVFKKKTESVFLILSFNGFGLCVGGLLKPKTVCLQQGLLI
jgi:hypothetical protein